MDIFSSVVSNLVSWPMVAIVALVVFRNPLMRIVERLVGSSQSRAKFGPVEVELGELADRGKQAVSTMTEINQLMAESRLLELEITRTHFGPVFTQEQLEELDLQIQGFHDALGRHETQTTEM